MHALIRLTPVPHLTQKSHKSRQIGEPELDGGHGNAVNHQMGSRKRRVKNKNEREGGHEENVQVHVHRCATCSSNAATCIHIKKKDKRNYFYKLFLSSGQDH